MTQLNDKKVRFYANSKTMGGYVAEEVSAMASELQERRSAAEVQEPVAVVDIQRGRGDGRKYALCYTSVGHSLPDDVYNLYVAPQPVAVPDERAAFNEWNNDTDCPLAGLTVKQAAWLAWLKRSETIKSFGRAEQLEPVSQPYTLPDGWKLVPVEPTQAMIDAHVEGVQSGGMQKGYRAMLAAAPVIPEFRTQAVDTDTTSTQFESLSAQGKPRCICIECGAAVPNPEKPHRCAPQEPTK